MRTGFGSGFDPFSHSCPRSEVEEQGDTGILRRPFLDSLPALAVERRTLPTAQERENNV